MPLDADHTACDEALPPGAATDRHGAGLAPTRHAAAGPPLEDRLVSGEPERARSTFGVPGELATRILSLLADDRPWRVKHIADRLRAEFAAGTVRVAAWKLADAGVLRRVRHGVVIAAGAPEPQDSDIPSLDPSVPETRAAELLDCAMTTHEFADVMRITPRVAVRTLVRAERAGLVGRILPLEQNPDARALWVRSGVDPDAALGARALRCRLNSQARLVSCLAPGEVHRMQDVEAALSAEPYALRQHVAEAALAGLACSARLGRKRYVWLTPEGEASPSRSPDAVPAAATANIISDLGPLTSAFIEALAVLGTAQTSELTAAIPDESRQSFGPSSAIIQRLQASGFFVAVEPSPARHAGSGRIGHSRHPVYRLTEAGSLAASFIARMRPPPQRLDLEIRIAQRRASKRSTAPAAA